MSEAKHFRKKGLDCGCCGMFFYTWPEYTDQDQDYGYGICKECQGWNEEYDRKETEKAYKTIIKSVTPARRKKLENEWGGTYDKRKMLVHYALDNGWLEFSIK